MEIRILHRQGKSIRSIARELSISRETVRKYLRAPGLEPGYGPRARRPSKLDPFEDYIRRRLREAAPRRLPATVLLRELRERGHPQDHLAGFRGWMHADGYAGFEDLYRSGDIREVACMAHIRRKFVDVHRAQGSVIAEEAIRRIAQLYAVEAEARGSPPDQRVEIRQAKARQIFDDLEAWLGTQLSSISGKSPLAAAIRYALTRMGRLRPYLDHGILELDNNPAERAMRAIALGRKNYLFVGSQAGGKAAAVAYTLIETAKLNDVDPQAWLADTIAQIPDYKITKIDDLLPRHCNA